MNGNAECLRVTVFSGGRGTATICEALVQHPRIALTIVVNAYDDGLSTGRLRNFIPGMLGPSDVRKNLSRLIPTADRAGAALKELLEFRFPASFGEKEAVACLGAFTRPGEPIPLDSLRPSADLINVAQARSISGYCEAFLNYYGKTARDGVTFDFGDCSLGNLFFAGCFLREGRDFNQTMRIFGDFCGSVGRVLNVTEGESYVLTALKEDGSVLGTEEAIVSPQNAAPIQELFLLKRALSREDIQTLQGLGSDARQAWLENRSCRPCLNPEVKRTVEETDLLIYGPGTQHSSLFPSYLTQGLGKAIANNVTAEKIFIGNILKDHEIQAETANTLVEKLVRYLSRGEPGQPPISGDRLITKFILHHRDPRSDRPPENAGDYVNFKESAFGFPLTSVIVGDWESKGGQHSGGRVVDELLAVVNSRLQKQLKPLPYQVSIVVPALNEAKTVKNVLHQLALLDFQSLGLSKEIIVVDGGSTDGTFELAMTEPDVRVYRLEGKRGRGSALRHGIEKATGNIIVFFPSDGEYDPHDLLPLVMEIAKNEYPVIFGSRAIKCVNLSEQIRAIYRNDPIGYFVGKYGGILLSILSLLLYNRFVSDVLTGVKAFDARLLKSLGLLSRGVDLETEIVARLGMRGVFILEVPVEFKPRRKIDGKKTTLLDGLRALYALIKYRVISS